MAAKTDNENIIIAIFISLSGVNTKILSSLPYEDKKPYLKLGLLNLAIGTFCTLAGYYIGRILFDFSKTESFIFCFFYFIASIYLQRIITGNLTNKKTGESKFSFFLAGVIISLLISFSVLVILSDNKIVNYDKKKTDVYQLLNSYVNTIQLQQKGGSNKKFIENVFKQKTSSVREYIDAFLDSSLEVYKNFTDRSFSDLKLLRSKDSSEIVEKVTNLSSEIYDLDNLRERYSFNNPYLMDTGMMVDTSNHKMAKSSAISSEKLNTNKIQAIHDSIDRLHSIPISEFTYILSYFNPGRFKTLQFSEKFGLILFYTDASTVMLFITAVVIMMLFYFFISIISNTYDNDLYHQLLSEETKLSSEALERQRKKISEIYKTQIDIRQTKEAFKQISTSENIDKEKVSKIIDQLKDEYTSSNLITIADIETKQGNFEKALEYINKAIELDFENPESWLTKSVLLNQLGRLPEEQDAKTRYVELLSNANFKKNIKQNIILQEIEFKNLPFYGSFIWKLKSKINILLGKNGFGKSHLLSIVLAQLQEENAALIELSRINSVISDPISKKSFLRIKIDNGEKYNSEEIKKLQQEINDLDSQKVSINKMLESDLVPNEIDILGNKLKKEATAELDKLSKEVELRYDKIEQLEGRSYFDKIGGIQSSYGKIPVLAIPDLRFINKSDESTHEITDEKAKKLLDFGAYHFINQVPYEKTIQNFLNTMCVVYYNDRQTFNDEIFQLINRVFNVLTGNEFKWKKISPTQDNSGNVIKVETDGNNEPISIQKISQGTLSILSIVGLIFHYLSLRYPDINRKEICKQQAIVFIDEIDAHLHPSWQQKLIGILRDEFPDIQFIITAHSPLIVAGCKEDEVAVLREIRNKEDNSITGFFVEKLYEDFIGYSTDELYKKIFSIENKDENYLKYISLIPGKSEMEAEVKSLEEAQNEGILTIDDQSKLAALNDNLYYIEKAKQRLESVVDIEKIKMENQMLKMELDLERSNSKTKSTSNA